MRTRAVKTTFRSTQEEKDKLKEKASEAGLKLNTYLLRMGLFGVIYVIPEIKDIFRQLKGMANNLNQLTHLCHMEKIKDPEIKESLKEISKGVRDLLLLLNSLIQKVQKTKFRNRQKRPGD